MRARILTSRDYAGKRVVVWPENLDSTLSRNQGRKLPVNECVPKPTIKEIIKAAEEAGLQPLVEDKKYPKRWWLSQGRVVVLKTGSKRETLRKLAAALRELRRKRV